MPITKKIRYVGHAGTFRITGAESGVTYTFAGHGAVVRVQVEDVDALLALTRTEGGCCGAVPQTNHLFAMA